MHPGYGFLSENPELALQCESKGLVFIGPSSQAISLYGDKIRARKRAEKAGIPVLPAEAGDVKDPKSLFQKAKKLSYPLMVKIPKGGGGKGLKLVYSEQELKRILSVVELEALENSESTEILLEKYLDVPRHVEVQFFVSANKELVIFGDRDCSSQRRHQKIIEEAPSHLPKHLKKQMGEVCFELGLEKSYQGAGTVEFLIQGEKFYFLEINTRLQVEHTVTEMIYGVDLLRAQILTAMGKPAFLTKEIPQPRGHSIQCRVCSEMPSRDFLPAAGQILHCDWPYGQSVRVDTAFYTGSKISSLYDSLIAKLLCGKTPESTL